MSDSFLGLWDAKAHLAFSNESKYGTRLSFSGKKNMLQAVLSSRDIKVTRFLMSEVMPHRLHSLSGTIGAFIQVACPRLSIDWGHFFGDTPLLTPYEAFVAFGSEPYNHEGTLFFAARPIAATAYPMDYYAHRGGIWTNFSKGLSPDPDTLSCIFNLQVTTAMGHSHKRAEHYQSVTLRNVADAFGSVLKNASDAKNNRRYSSSFFFLFPPVWR